MASLMVNENFMEQDHSDETNGQPLNQTSTPSIGVTPPSTISLPSPIVILSQSNTDFNNCDLVNGELIKLPKDLIKFYSVNKNKNLVVYPVSVEAKNRILSCEPFFKDFKKIDLSNFENRPCLIIKDMSYGFAQTFKNQLAVHGIIDVIEIKRKGATMNETEIKKIKAVCDSVNTRDKLLREHLVVCYKKFFTEPSFKQPSMCYKCNTIGHLEADCPSKFALCGRCSMQKHEGLCSSRPKCINCNGEHSSFYKGCPVYENAKKLALQKILPQMTQKLKSNSDFTRNYSDVASTNKNNNIEALLGQIIQQNKAQSLDLKQNLAKVESSLNEKIDKILDQCPSREEIEERFDLQSSVTNQSITGSMNAVVNVMYDAMKLMVKADQYEVLNSKIIESCRKNMVMGKSEIGELNFRPEMPQYFKIKRARDNLNDDSSLTIDSIRNQLNGK